MSPRDERRDPDVLGAHEEHALLRATPWRRFAVIGDSVAEGVGDPVPGYAALSWAERIARALRTNRPGFAYRNLGVRHLRAAEVRATQLDAALAFAPDLASVAAGGNDALARRFDPDAVEAELDGMVAALREAGADVLLWTYMDITRAIELDAALSARLADRMGTLNAIAAAIAERRGAALADCAAHPRAADPGVYSADGLHLNHRGHAVAASEAIRALARLAPRPVAAAGVG